MRCAMERQCMRRVVTTPLTGNRLTPSEARRTMGSAGQGGTGPMPGLEGSATGPPDCVSEPPRQPAEIVQTSVGLGVLGRLMMVPFALVVSCSSGLV